MTSIEIPSDIPYVPRDASGDPLPRMGNPVNGTVEIYGRQFSISQWDNPVYCDFFQGALPVLTLGTGNESRFLRASEQPMGKQGAFFEVGATETDLGTDAYVCYAVPHVRAAFAYHPLRNLQTGRLLPEVGVKGYVALNGKTVVRYEYSSLERHTIALANGSLHAAAHDVSQRTFENDGTELNVSYHVKGMNTADESLHLVTVAGHVDPSVVILHLPTVRTDEGFGSHVGSLLEGMHLNRYFHPEAYVAALSRTFGENNFYMKLYDTHA